MTPKRRAELLKAYGGLCAACGLPITEPGWRADHVLPIWMGGLDEISNLQPVHFICDLPKTAADIRRIAKTKRQMKMSDPRPPSKFKSRGFDRVKRPFPKPRGLSLNGPK
jgi:5-methylcytosine-specific restriction endonuclease McrA